jgi:hypothetical protein
VSAQRFDFTCIGQNSSTFLHGGGTQEFSAPLGDTTNFPGFVQRGGFSIPLSICPLFCKGVEPNFRPFENFPVFFKGVVF